MDPSYNDKNETKYEPQEKKKCSDSSGFEPLLQHLSEKDGKQTTMPSRLPRIP